MSLIQLFILLVVLVVVWRLYTRWQKKEITLVEFLEWLALWLVAAIITLLPQVASYLANVVGVGRGSDLVVYLAILLVFYLLFKIFVRLERFDKQLTKIVRHLAINELDDKNK